MIDQKRLRHVDAQRRQAMIEADRSVLESLLSEDLTWTHSSGASETKTEFVEAIVSGNVIYDALEIEQDQVWGVDPIFIHNGILIGQASRDGQAKALRAKFLAVWCDVDGRLQLTAWQSTNCSL
jgi:hypothetical protein